MIERLNKVCDILGAVNLVEPRPLKQLGCTVGEIGSEYAVDYTVGISLVKGIKTVGEDSIGSIAEDPSCIALLKLNCNIEHGFAGGDDIVHDDDRLALDAGAEVLMRDDRVASAHDARIVVAKEDETTAAEDSVYLGTLVVDALDKRL